MIPGSGFAERAGMIRAALFGLVACIVAVCVALGAQRFGGLIPCPLCLWERWPYRVGIYAALFAILLRGTWRGLAVCVLCVAMLAAVALAATHVGVEQRWWKSPLPECSAPDFHGMSVAQRLAAMHDRPSKSCEDADYPVPGLPVSFAQGNLIYALAVCAGLAISLRGTIRRPA